MDFVRSYFFPNATLISWTFLRHFCHHFWVGATAKQHQTHPKVMSKMVKKCSTGQSCIQKEVTSYKIHTLNDRFTTLSGHFFAICLFIFHKTEAHIVKIRRRLKWMVPIMAIRVVEFLCGGYKIRKIFA
jgi:hypothetical protein